VKILDHSIRIMSFVPSKILKQLYGRFDKRFGIGPVSWPFFDLLWVHSGTIKLCIGIDREILTISAPAGILIFPDTAFSGQATGGVAHASICHFLAPETDTNGYHLSAQADRHHIQNLIQFSLSYEQRTTPMEIRIKLLAAICDCFGQHIEISSGANPAERAWRMAQEKLDQIRGLSDVANFANLSESAFRAMHSRHYSTSAGRHLQNMRFLTAERLLVTTGDTVREISSAVGYAHAESFSAAFTKSRGKTPAAYRRWCQRLA